MSEIPEGFERHTRRSGLTAPWEPIYARRTGEALILALRASDAHANSRGLVHGGLISALADNAMGLSCGVRSEADGAVPALDGLVTVSLSVDFLGPARKGQWLEFRTGFVRLGSTLCFAQCFVHADGTACARANASFRVLGRPAALAAPGS